MIGEASLQEDQLRLELVLEIAKMGMWDFDPRGSILYWSERAKSFFGMPPDEEVTYEKFINAVHPDDREITHRTMQTALNSTSGKYDLEFRTVGKTDGIVRSIRATGLVHFNSGGDPVRLIGVSWDVTKHRQEEAELRQARDKAEDADRIKTQFLANMSHEMRTPLSAILGFSDLAMDPDCAPERVKQYLFTIRRNGESLLKLINEVLDLSKVEANKVEVEEFRFPFRDALEEVLSVFRAAAQEKQIELSVSSLGSVPEFIETDPFRFKQILTNLVGNAIKFTDRGRVHLCVRVIPPLILGKHLKIEIAIRDTGIGISSHQSKKLFQRFSQADNSVSRKYGGTGLGLALSQQLARALGGDVTLRESSPGLGSTFVFIFEDSVYRQDMPFIHLNCEDRPTPLAAETHYEVNLEGTKVLLVEDAPDNQMLVSLMLKAAGAHVDVAENGLEGIEKAVVEDYDVVLMDIQMPVLDGYRATMKLREKGYKKPIIALTAHAMTEEKDKCLSAGFDDHLTKPINRKDLLSEVAMFSSRANGERQIAFH
jgi:PAS domain S-box-containing protein